MSLEDKQQAFIGHLLGLAQIGKEDRAALAELRSGLGREPGQMPRVHRHVVPYLRNDTYDDDWYYLTATLFGSYPRHKHGQSFGVAFRTLKGKSESMEARFVSLLNAPPEDLGDHLRHAVSLLKANEQPLDWYRLFDDLLQWDSPAGYIQLRWAREFYGANATNGGYVRDPDTDDNHTSEREVEDHE